MASSLDGKHTIEGARKLFSVTEYVAVGVAVFDHVKGPSIENFSCVLAESAIDWKAVEEDLPFFTLPDGAHYTSYPSSDAASSFRLPSTDEIKHVSNDEGCVTAPDNDDAFTVAGRDGAEQNEQAKRAHGESSDHPECRERHEHGRKLKLGLRLNKYFSQKKKPLNTTVTQTVRNPHPDEDVLNTDSDKPFTIFRLFLTGGPPPEAADMSDGFFGLGQVVAMRASDLKTSVPSRNSSLCRAVVHKSFFLITRGEPQSWIMTLAHARDVLRKHSSVLHNGKHSKSTLDDILSALRHSTLLHSTSNNHQPHHTQSLRLYPSPDPRQHVTALRGNIAGLIAHNLPCLCSCDLFKLSYILVGLKALLLQQRVLIYAPMASWASVAVLFFASLLRAPPFLTLPYMSLKHIHCLSQGKSESPLRRGFLVGTTNAIFLSRDTLQADVVIAIFRASDPRPQSVVRHASGGKGLQNPRHLKKHANETQVCDPSESHSRTATTPSGLTVLVEVRGSKLRQALRTRPQELKMIRSFLQAADEPAFSIDDSLPLGSSPSETSHGLSELAETSDRRRNYNCASDLSPSEISRSVSKQFPTSPSNSSFHVSKDSARDSDHVARSYVCKALKLAQVSPACPLTSTIAEQPASDEGDPKTEGTQTSDEAAGLRIVAESFPSGTSPSRSNVLGDKKTGVHRRLRVIQSVMLAYGDLYREAEAAAAHAQSLKEENTGNSKDPKMAPQKHKNKVKDKSESDMRKFGSRFAAFSSQIQDVANTEGCKGQSVPDSVQSSVRHSVDVSRRADDINSGRLEVNTVTCMHG